MDSGSELKYKLLTENCSTLVNTTIFRWYMLQGAGHSIFMTVYLRKCVLT